MEQLTNFDFQLLHGIQRIFSNSFLDFLMPKITALGNGGILWILIAVFLLCIPKTRKNGAQLGVSSLGCGLIGNVLLKNLVARDRPCWLEQHIMLIATPHDYSFPSGHTMVSFAAATVLWQWNRKVGIAAYGLAGLIAFSRLYLFVHFPSDVLAGAVIGCLIGIAAGKLVDLAAEKIPQKLHCRSAKEQHRD